MASCEVCGNDYRLSFEVHAAGSGARVRQLRVRHPCAAPVCEHCGVKVIGHGVEADGTFFCCASCARMHGDPASASELVDHAGRAPND